MHFISGGQTGVDRAVLDACMARGFPAGGWCPAGRRAEDGVIAEYYPVRELPQAGYAERTAQNVVDSDATVVIYAERAEGGTRLTLDKLREFGVPCIEIDLAHTAVPEAADAVLQFIDRHRVDVLNWAGPRASKCARGYEFAAELARQVIDRLEARGGTGAGPVTQAHAEDTCPIECPHCGEPFDIFWEVGDLDNEYIEDCRICCQPIRVVLSADEAGEVSASVRRDVDV